MTLYVYVYCICAAGVNISHVGASSSLLSGWWHQQISTHTTVPVTTRSLSSASRHGSARCVSCI